MSRKWDLPRMSGARQAALASIGITGSAGLLDAAAQVVAERVNAENPRTRTQPADARGWILKRRPSGDRRALTEEIDPATHDGWEAFATFLVFFQEQGRRGAGAAASGSS